MGSIFCIGQSAYDITIPLDGAICENQKYRVTQKEECGGGPAFNAAYLCAMWGEKQNDLKQTSAAVLRVYVLPALAHGFVF